MRDYVYDVNSVVVYTLPYYSCRRFMCERNEKRLFFRVCKRTRHSTLILISHSTYTHSHIHKHTQTYTQNDIYCGKLRNFRISIRKIAFDEFFFSFSLVLHWDTDIDSLQSCFRIRTCSHMNKKKKSQKRKAEK